MGKELKNAKYKFIGPKAWFKSLNKMCQTRSGFNSYANLKIDLKDIHR